MSLNLMPGDTQQALLLLNWLSPAFPIGSFAYSHGLEQAIAEARVHDGQTLEGWLATLIANGSAWCDALLFARCWEDDAEHLNAMALALAGSAERYHETLALGRSFQLALNVWQQGAVRKADWAYPVVAGLHCASAGIARETAVAAFLNGFCLSQVSVAVRLVPLGQTQGLVVMKALLPLIADVAQRACAAAIDAIGSHAITADMMAMRHETLEPRIFRT